jgi:Cu/Ag efflux pump CusA
MAAGVPAGYKVAWLGMFENLDRAYEHFRLLIPATVVLIFLLLWATFGSFRCAMLVLAGIPFACVGGVLALYVRGMHMNVSTGVGFAALFGIAIMDGVLTCSSCRCCTGSQRRRFRGPHVVCQGETSPFWLQRRAGRQRGRPRWKWPEMYTI